MLVWEHLELLLGKKNESQNFDVPKTEGRETTKNATIM
jgi:hypothetical protein